MINSNSVIVQCASETTYGTFPVMTSQFAWASQSFKPVFNKKDEGLKTGGKSTGKVSTMSVKSEGSLQVLARPDDVGIFLKHSLGVEANPVLVVGATGAYEHFFTSLGTSLTDSLKSLAFAVDRKTDVFGYVGYKINTLAFSVSPEDYLKLDLGFVGKDEIIGVELATGISTSPLNAFRFRNGKVLLNSVEVAKVDSIKLDYNNNLNASIQTTSSGQYFEEPQCGARDIKVDFSAVYGTNTETLMTDWYKTDDLFSLELAFTSELEVEDGIPYSLTITLPNCQLSDSARDESDSLKHSFSAKAVEDGADELITFKLVNGLATKY